MTRTPEHATYRIIRQRGTADCAVAALAMALRRDYEEVLIAAAKVKPTVWTAGLHATDMAKVARKLGAKPRWTTTFDLDDARGVLWVSHHDSTREHCVFLLDGMVFEPEHDPVSVWDCEDYYRAQNAYGNQLLLVE